MRQKHDLLERQREYGDKSNETRNRTSKILGLKIEHMNYNNQRI